MTKVFTNVPISEKEKEEYINYVHEKYKGRRVKDMNIEIEDEFVNITCHFDEQPFHRIRRITGYLGDISRFNEGKRAEVADRITHD